MNKMISDGGKGLGPVPNALLAFLVIVGISIGIIFVIEGEIGSRTHETEEYTEFTSENYGFSFSYPSNWTIENREYPTQNVLMVYVTENETENVAQEGSAATIQVNAGKLNLPPLENILNNFTQLIENDENVTLTTGPENIQTGSLPGIDITIRSKTSQGEYRSRQMILNGENSDYGMIFIVKENSYNNFKSDLDQIFDSFTILEK